MEIKGSFNSLKGYVKEKCLHGSIAAALILSPALSFAADPAATGPQVDITKIVDDAKLVIGGILTMLIALFAIKLWRRVFGGA